MRNFVLLLPSKKKAFIDPHNTKCFSISSHKEKISSSRDWYQRHSKDEFVKKSKLDNYRARSAYKLIEMQDKYKIINPGYNVVECGAAPGAWTQVISQILGGNGRLVACDLLSFEPVEHAVILPNTDFTLPNNQLKILNHFENEKINTVLSDMAPNITGNKTLDQDASLFLVYSVLKFALQHTAKDGSLLVKLFNSSNTNRFLTDLRKFYRKVDIVKPASSRKESSEIFVLATNFAKA